MSRASIAVIFLEFLAVVWWIFLQTQSSHTTPLNYWFNGFYGLVFLVGGLIGLFSTAKVGGLKSSIGNALIFTAGGLAMYGVGQMTWLVYNLIGTDIPYPSYADVFYVSYVPLIALGFWHILKIFKTMLKPSTVIQFVLMVMLVVAGVTLFINQPDLSKDLPFMSKALNIYYPFADSVLIAIAILTFRLSSDKFNKTILFFIFGLTSQAIADFIFTYSTAHGTYWNGDISDLLFSFGGLFVSLGVITLVDGFTIDYHNTTETSSDPLII